MMTTVLDRPLPEAWAMAATVEGYRRVRQGGEGYPVLVPAPGNVVSGVVVDWLD